MNFLEEFYVIPWDCQLQGAHSLNPEVTKVKKKANEAGTNHDIDTRGVGLTSMAWLAGFGVA